MISGNTTSYNHCHCNSICWAVHVRGDQHAFIQSFILHWELMMYLDAEVKMINKIDMVLPFGAYNLTKKDIKQLEMWSML